MSVGFQIDKTRKISVISGGLWCLHAAMMSQQNQSRLNIIQKVHLYTKLPVSGGVVMSSYVRSFVHKVNKTPTKIIICTNVLLHAKIPIECRY